MSEEYARKMGLPEGHTIVETDSKWHGSRKGQDKDSYVFDELNAVGEVVCTWDVEDSTSIYPPFGRTISVSKRS